MCCLQECQFNVINQFKAQISEGKAEIKATFLGLDIKTEMGDKPTEFTELTEQLQSSEREEKTISLKKQEMGDKPIELIE